MCHTVIVIFLVMWNIYFFFFLKNTGTFYDSTSSLTNDNRWKIILLDIGVQFYTR